MQLVSKFFFILIFVSIPQFSKGQQVFDIALYENEINENKEYWKTDPEVDTLAFAVTNPTIKVFLPSVQNKKKQAVLICPGGGYHTLLMSREGYRIAREFNKYGIIAIVLKYRLPNIIQDINEKPLAPIRDVQKSIKVIRDRYKVWNVEIKKLGVMGFSAGGHLAAFSATHYQFPFISNPEDTNLRPDFALLINPIISMKEDIGHIGSRNNLMSNDPAIDKVYFYSNELFVNKQTPPVFLSHTKDDTVVPVENSLLFFKKLSLYGVRNRLIIYDKGDHGYLEEPSFETWFSDCLNWLKRN